MTRAKPAKPRKKARQARAGALSADVAGRPRLQYAALPWRMTDRLEIMLVSSRETRRWIIPKGWPMAGRSGAAAAAIEAIEEAGLLGAISPEPIGHFDYAKRFTRSMEICRVKVFSLRVLRQRATWPEMHQRDTQWFPAEEAMALVSDPELGDLIGAFIGSFAS
jgi:8-oxo-dGTP pyrophosphatase MutT (NUDIX family)